MNISKYDGLSSFLDFYDLKKNELISKIILTTKIKVFFFYSKKEIFKTKIFYLKRIIYIFITQEKIKC